ncbi:glycosyltransferase [Candidatus Bathyarchaeota archaeon]|nr:MAG: glycosyltransferase [Candidatus Bathyarchaeota archaeon]
MKKVLVVASDFPPQGKGNILRVVKFVKYLPSFGWQPIVLTVNEGSIAWIDRSMEKEYPKNLKVYRAFFPNPFVFLDRRWAKKEKTIANRWGEETKENRGGQPIFSLIWMGKKVVLNAVRLIRKHFLIPGEHITWLPFAVSKGVGICRQENIDIIFSTAPGFVNHLVALLIKRFTQKKWIADYRDLWTGNPYSKSYSKVRRAIETYLDRAVLKNADGITVVTDGWKEFMLKRWNFLTPEKVTTITNGYDLEDFENLQYRSENHSKFTITHMGTIFEGYPTPLFLDVVGKICSENPEIRNNLKINLTGDIYPEQIREIKRVINRWNLEEIVSINGRVPHSIAVKVIRDSDLLLLMYTTGRPNIEGCIPSKLFDYIAAERPILAIVPSNGIAAEIVRNGKCGKVINPDDTEGMKKAFLEFYNKLLSGELYYHPNHGYLKQFNRRYLTYKLSELFYKLLCIPHPKSWTVVRVNRDKGSLNL